MTNAARRPIPPEWSLTATFAALFVIAAVFLFIRIDQGLDPDFGKDWWTLSFENRDPSSITFTVENHSSQADFSYVVFHAGMEVGSGDFSVDRGSEGTIEPGFTAVAGRTVVSVRSSDGRMLEIYRER